ncbi:sorting nexin-30-like isoform X2 [Dysidea avara]
MDEESNTTETTETGDVTSSEAIPGTMSTEPQDTSNTVTATNTTEVQELKPQSEDGNVDPLLNKPEDSEEDKVVDPLLSTDESPTITTADDDDKIRDLPKTDEDVFTKHRDEDNGDDDIDSNSFEHLSPFSDDMQPSSKGFREVLAEDLQQSLLDHYERADLELSLPPPGRTGAMRNIPVVKIKGDLEVSIEDHQKHMLDGTELFISYKVCVKTTRLSSFEQESYEVWRRYNDFDWLRRQMIKTHPSLIVPPLPGKQLSKLLNHLSPEFINNRKLALVTFLTRLVEHPILTFDKYLKIFLTASSEQFAREQVGSINSSFWSGLSDSMQKATASLWLRNPDQDFAKHMKYASNLSEKLAAVERAGNKLQEERNALVTANRDFYPVVNSWANSEMILADPLSQLATCNNECCKAITQLNMDNMLTFQLKVKEYQLYCATVQSALKNRDRMQLNSDTLLEEKAKKCKARDEAKAAAKVSRLPKLEKDVETVTIQSEKALDDLEKCNADLRMDIEHWHKQKDADFCQLMTATADNHINFHQKCFTKWEELLRVLKDFKTASTIETIDGPSTETESSVVTSEEH